MLWRRTRRRDPEIAPEDIFLDATNVSAFDRSRFEGRIEKPLPSSTFVVLSGVLMLLIVVLIGRAWDLEVIRGAAFAAQSA